MCFCRPFVSPTYPPPPPPEWSHAFSEGVDLLMHQSATLLTYHDKQALLRSWDTDTGHLEWEIVLERTSRGGRWEGEGVKLWFTVVSSSLSLYYFIFHPHCAITCFILASNVFQPTVCSNVCICTYLLHPFIAHITFKSSSVN